MPVTIRLPHRLGIILPSRDRGGRRLPAQARRVIKEVVADWFGRAFPGSTSDRMQLRPRLRGRWGTDPAVTVEEVEEVWVYCSAADFRKHKGGLVHLAEWVAREGDQEAVAILIDSGMELVVGKENVMSVKELESKLNRRLREIHRGYAVKNLKRLPSGEYWFDLAMAFNPRDLAKVNRACTEVLGKPARKRETVQAKFYLTPRTYERLRKRAAARGVPQSTLVEEALESALA